MLKQEGVCTDFSICSDYSPADTVMCYCAYIGKACVLSLLLFCCHAAASNQEVADMLPHLRGQGTLDLEYEADGEPRHTHTHTLARQWRDK